MEAALRVDAAAVVTDAAVGHALIQIYRQQADVSVCACVRVLCVCVFVYGYLDTRFWWPCSGIQWDTGSNRIRACSHTLRSHRGFAHTRSHLNTQTKHVIKRSPQTPSTRLISGETLTDAFAAAVQSVAHVALAAVAARRRHAAAVDAQVTKRLAHVRDVLRQND